MLNKLTTLDAQGRIRNIIQVRAEDAATWPAPADHTIRDYQPGDVIWQEEAPQVVPALVTNYQARAVMRSFILSDGRSLETAVREYLWAQKTAAAVLPEANTVRISADTAWLAWEQSNHFERHGLLIRSLGPAFGLDAGAIDALFVAADLVTA